MIVADIIAQFFKKIELTSLFGVGGANIEDLLNSVVKTQASKIIMSKTEQQGCLMAMGGYLAKHKPNVAFSTSGAGVLNTLPILAESKQSKIPFVLIAGLPPESLWGKGAFQDTSGLNCEVNLLSLLEGLNVPTHLLNSQTLNKVIFSNESYSKRSFELKNLMSSNEQNRIDKFNSYLFDLFQESLEKKTPLVLLIPKNIFNLNIIEICGNENTSDPFFVNDKNHNLSQVCFFENQETFLKNIQNHCENAQSQNPSDLLVILGDEYLHCENKIFMTNFINKYDLPYMVTPNAKGASLVNPKNFKGLLGIMGDESQIEHLKKSKILLSLGCQFDHLQRIAIENELIEKNIYLISEFDNYNYLDLRNIQFLKCPVQKFLEVMV